MRSRYIPHIFDELEALCQLEPSGCCSGESCEKQSKGLWHCEDETNLYIDAHLPGVDPKEVEVTIDPKKRHLLIRGEGKIKRDNVKWHIKDSQSYSFEVPLPNAVDADSKIEAVSRDGVLSITLAKNKGHKPLKINVRVA